MQGKLEKTEHTRQICLLACWQTFEITLWLATFTVLFVMLSDLYGYKTTKLLDDMQEFLCCFHMYVFKKVM